MQTINALTINSSSYSVGISRTSLIESNAQSANYNSTTGATTQTSGNAQSPSFQASVGSFSDYGAARQREKDFFLSITSTESIIGGQTYIANMELRDGNGNLINASSLPSINIYDSLGNLIVNNVFASFVATGKYKYEFVTAPTHITGNWNMVVGISVEGNLKEYYDIWQLTSPTQISIISITDNTLPTITADLLVSNEGNVDYEYQYEYCLVSKESDQCGESNNIDYATGAKLIKKGESWRTQLTLEAGQIGRYWFKIIFSYGDNQKSGASKSFTAVSQPTTSNGGGSGGSSGGGGSSDSLITGNTINYPVHLMDVEMTILDDYKTVQPDSKILAKVTLYNLGTEEIKDAYLTYCIKTESGDIVKCIKETVAVYTKIQLIKEFLVSKDMTPGRYYIETTSQYGNETASSQATFLVSASARTAILPEVRTNFFLLIIVILIASIILIILAIFLLRSRRDKLKEDPDFIRAQIGEVEELKNRKLISEKKYLAEKENLLENLVELTKQRKYPFIISVIFIGFIFTGLYFGKKLTGFSTNVSMQEGNILLPIIIVCAIIIIFIFRRKIFLGYIKIKDYLINKICKSKKNRVTSLVGKKVYLESGYYIGKIKEVVLGENRIDSLKIKLNKKHQFKSKGIIVNYRHVKNVGEIIIIEEKIIEYMNNYKDLEEK